VVKKTPLMARIPDSEIEAMNKEFLASVMQQQEVLYLI